MSCTDSAWETGNRALLRLSELVSHPDSSLLTQWPVLLALCLVFANLVVQTCVGTAGRPT